MKPTLGILITYYNEKQLLRQCLESLLNGNSRPDEIMIYDDASRYPPEEHIPKNIRVQIIRGDDNQGPSYGRNCMLKKSQSDYIHFHDADDLFLQNWCERVRQVIDEKDIDAVFTEISSEKDGQVLSEKVLGFKSLSEGDDLVRFCMRGSVLVPSGTYRREVVSAIGGYRENLWQSEDFDFHVRLAIENIRYEVILDPLIRIRVRPGSRSQNQREVWAYKLKALQILSKELPPKYLRDLAQEAFRTGSKLYQLGSVFEAKQAFQLARNFGPVSFAERNQLYRLIAQSIGPEAAECLGALYREILPRKVRSCLSNLKL